ncbi:3-hydroxyacyl-CoA dehydrogenase [Hydrogenophaga crassostreae]|uniref:3-hydroxyacyl-CoA dehydrogenase n=1 Tax=Hydrogenophaga crassostreae TaxID=1763535 RepID=A0A163CFW8_9BURK|nr:3-hydroxyacyl-CoA dehydrogenase [Hydrogenophaga crassostreae]AOW13631.1 3-hydroxyacyl-CoA dehydrogenase [Hydrogenophaga crassostreae]OAD41928.1 3-hydroxyacyl-CoA dehydrogenase [Hydrogenophaga crassostreae]
MQPFLPLAQPIFQTVGVIGGGAMGRGIAQMAVQAGSDVFLLDSQPGAAQAAIAAITAIWDRLVTKGKLTDEMRNLHLTRLSAAPDAAALAPCNLIIEAIVERIDIKQRLFSEIESLVAPGTVLATNTSSLSVTAIAANLQRPAQLAGFHFFNPVPLMRVVEVVAGLKTSPVVCEQLTGYARQFGHTPVAAQDTPGFIVNHAGRGYGTEALRVVSERIADFATVDRILRDQMGFKLGPFELMDLTALDVSHPVMESIYRQYFDEPRYRPSVITAQRLAGGVIGKKVGEGFYSYLEGAAQIPEDPPAPVVKSLPPVWVSPKAARRSELYQLLKDLGAHIETAATPSSTALILVAPLGLDVTTLAAVERLDATRTIGIDMMLEDTATRRRVLATNPATRPDMRDAAHALFAQDGKAVSVVRDSGGFVTQRVVATIINIAADMCQQGVCSPSDLDLAVTLGLGYPMGPLAMGDRIGPTNVLEILFNMQTVYGDPRYRPSPWLRRRGALGLSLSHEEA